MENETRTKIMNAMLSLGGEVKEGYDGDSMVIAIEDVCPEAGEGLVRVDLETMSVRPYGVITVYGDYTKFKYKVRKAILKLAEEKN